MYVDGSLYPDEPAPAALDSDAAKADYLQRVCGAWDYGIVPELATLDLLAGWRDIFDRYPIPASVAYHALRALYAWPPVPAAPWLPPALDADAREGRVDPCAAWV